MRITNQMMINSSLANIQVNKSQLSTLETQLSTQKKINKPSDDPIVAIRALRLRSSLNQVTEYLNNNIPDAESWLDTTESALDEANTIVTKLYEYCTQGASSSYSTSERSTLADTLEQLKDAFYSEGDVDYSGRYVFTGYQTDTPLTYQSDSDAADVDYTITQSFSRDDFSTKTIYTNAYTSDDIINLNLKTDSSGNIITPDTTTVNRLRTGYTDVEDTGFSMTYDDTTISVSDDGTTATYSVYQYDADGNMVTDDNGDPVLGTATATADENGSFTITTLAGDTVKISTTTDSNYEPEDNEIAFNATTGEILFGDTTYKKAYSSDDFSFTYQKDNFVKGDVNPTMYFDCVDNNTGVTYTKEDENIEYSVNYSQKLTVNTQASDAFSIYLGRDIDDLKTSVQNVIDIETQIEKINSMLDSDQYSDTDSQDTLNSMLDGLTKQYELAQDQMTQAFETGLGQMQDYQEQVSLAKSNVGNTETRLDLTKSRLTEQQTNFTSLKSSNEDIDLETVVVSYSSAQVVYNASLTAASKVVQQSLLDFL